jgi:hypothetical protein
MPSWQCNGGRSSGGTGQSSSTAHVATHPKPPMGNSTHAQPAESGGHLPLHSSSLSHGGGRGGGGCFPLAEFGFDKRSADSAASSPELLELTQAIENNMALDTNKQEMIAKRGMISSSTGEVFGDGVKHMACRRRITLEFESLRIEGQ